MIFGTGVDLVEIARIGNSLEKFSPRFEERIFTEEEIRYCRAQAEPVKHFAGRFAVKEAVMKSLGTGMVQGIGFKDIEVLNEASGKPVLHLAGKARERFEECNLAAIHISLSHDKNYAIASAIAET